MGCDGFEQNAIDIGHTVLSCDIGCKRILLASDITKVESSMPVPYGYVLRSGRSQERCSFIFIESVSNTSLPLSVLMLMAIERLFRRLTFTAYMSADGAHEYDCMDANPRTVLALSNDGQYLTMIWLTVVFGTLSRRCHGYAFRCPTTSYPWRTSTEFSLRYSDG